MKWRGRLKLKKFKAKTWQLLLILIPLLFIDATLLRLDHIKMTELRDAVMAADEAENDEEISRALEELKRFVFSNIVINEIEDNGVKKVIFGTGPFYLEHQYIRHANAALAEAEANLASDANPNGNIYGMASSACSSLAIQNGWTWNDSRFINCMLTEINKYPAAGEIQDQIIAALPSTELYRKNYASPMWAWSFTGVMILITLIMIVVIFIRGIIWVILRISLLFI